MAKADAVPEIMTAKQLAAYLRLDPQTIYKKFRRGEIPGARIGKAVRFKKDVIDAWLRRVSWAWGPEKKEDLRRWAEDFAREKGISEDDVSRAVASRRRR